MPMYEFLSYTVGRKMPRFLNIRKRGGSAVIRLTVKEAEEVSEKLDKLFDKADGIFEREIGPILQEALKLRSKLLTEKPWDLK